MNLKKIKIISTIGIFILCFLTHFIYNLFPNYIFAIFFPVNESIWEHMKMLYTTILLYGIIEYLLIIKFNIKTNNYLLNLFVVAIISIPLYLLIFLPIYYKFGENMFITLTILFIVIVIVNYLSYYLLKIKKINYSNIIAIVLIIITYIVFGYLTYNPIKNDLFFDTEEEKYGIDDYIT